METAGNGSDVNYRSQLPVLFNNSSFCGNFTDHNTTSNAEPRCDGDRGLANSLLDDTNPVIIAIVITALYSIVCVVGLVGNVLVMYIIVSCLARLDEQLYLVGRIQQIVNVCNWILSSAIGLPVMFMASTDLTSSSIVDCKLIFPHPSWYWDTLLKICVFIFAFIMPVLIITVCYGLMILRLKSVRMLSGSQEKDRNLRRITRMVLVVVAVFIVCWTPIHIFVIITALINIPTSTLQTITWHFCIALGYTNSSLNPVLYGYLDENFKRCFREFCTPSPSVLEMQNSSRTGVTSRKLPQRERNTGNTGERSNQQV
ncbi:hypothetical protein FQN60_014825 [Etheostoma spectabile]|uniref:G-protein coupled receptors family 1 profile domain-containing protein n=1 Tax=Etheostoma spectabile TaxID=54343 RepID=A0A5J5CPI1_9PERO|nr:hypothetical protein FQN60_014825 [Etheostoma spectabile]